MFYVTKTSFMMEVQMWQETNIDTLYVAHINQSHEVLLG